ncbi:LemA family protein [Oleiagrimonas citrea]|jgi:LemA protein|uniref:LemA family protein n=1 Tax=Oleiagrimonas citrea TaxID=1665687 RepID=A0A846ZK86_9GAMM|nr:LemA family protein [Oleiagrimonas citrea]NKZ38406.1 LemA family protein [Oleiagrimonas citrea]
MGIREIVEGAIALLVLSYVVLIYNNLVQLKHNAAKAWANIDVLLKQRHDELPKLVEVCKQYMRYEQSTLEQIVQARAEVFSARAAADLKELGQAEQMLRDGLTHLFALAENYPDLKADTSFKHLQSRISGLENAIADRRELYNDSVNLFRVRIDQFPDLLVARVFRFRPPEMLRFSARETRDVDIKALFG